MKCQEINHKIDDFVDGEWDLAHEVEQHMEECSKCREKYEELLKLKADLQGMKEKELKSYQRDKREERIFFNEMWKKVHYDKKQIRYGFIWTEIALLVILIILSIIYPEHAIHRYGFSIGALLLFMATLYLNKEKRNQHEYME